MGRDLADCFELGQFRLFRCLVGGVWYKHASTGQLPGLYGSFWSRTPPCNRYTAVIKTEDYRSKSQ